MTGKSNAAQQTNSPSDFDGLIKHGIKLLAEVRRLGASKKLTGPAFLALACKHAGLDAWVGGTGGIKIESDEGAVSKLNEIERKVAQAGIAELNGFISRVARAYAGDGYPCPFGSDKFGKAIRVFGVEGETLASLNAAKITIGECLALAAHRAAMEHPDRFGDIEDWVAHLEAVNLAHDQLAGICAELSRSWTMKDVEIDGDLNLEDPAFNDDAEIARAADDRTARYLRRKQGLVRLTFKGHPDIHIGMDDFPMKLIERASADGGKAESKVESANDKPARKRLSSEADSIRI